MHSVSSMNNLIKRRKLPMDPRSETRGYTELKLHCKGNPAGVVSRAGASTGGSRSGGAGSQSRPAPVRTDTVARLRGLRRGSSPSGPLFSPTDKTEIISQSPSFTLT
ncbi:hypothetical protein BaRGS_00002433 [Batillaria attramentaria]|uniref:Uncharacterized protein n=1 Tax=Batillaria attramentaria TaxID=370345 RepID=A0ABD0M3I6_9CAEN